ncbi:MSHA biogenesis protein MshP [Thalassotalea psychrophila]|uniref:MSHA biogenesis protein MshP n=1 Tax=Thalassotalea psychrophila TaxID=3065647 RepID=A0ABY9TVU7_9GAMM|nr:MSHA biogenesis protein MshP [Colwelliaceae bacterium SQ149]
MCHKKSLRSKQRGASLIMAVFMIVIFSLFAAVLVRMIGSSSENISYEVIGTRAYAAADTGNQWALQQLFQLNTSTSSCVDVTTPPDISAVNGLIGCRVANLQCDSFVESGVTYFTLTSTGVCDSGDVSTSRTLQVDARTL